MTNPYHELTPAHLEKSKEAWEMYKKGADSSVVDSILGENVLDELFRRAKVYPDLLAMCEDQIKDAECFCVEPDKASCLTCKTADAILKAHSA